SASPSSRIASSASSVLWGGCAAVRVVSVLGTPASSHCTFRLSASTVSAASITLYTSPTIALRIRSFASRYASFITCLSTPPSPNSRPRTRQHHHLPRSLRDVHTYREGRGREQIQRVGLRPSRAHLPPAAGAFVYRGTDATQRLPRPVQVAHGAPHN